ncbi:MAG TPA: STAS/SEC14 domain-containing protein [Methylomirabilota bacterium]
MPVEIGDASGKLVEVKIVGTLWKADYERLVELVRGAIAREGRIRALVVTERFQGWERGADWGDVSFVTEQGRAIEKMAIVGEERWREEVLGFTGKGLRPTAIEFFPPSQMIQARAWLSA